MKNVFKCALLLLSLCTGFMMEAAEDLDVKVLNNLNVKVELNKIDKGDVLLLTDPFGNILFKDSIALMGTYQKTFNLELVPIGMYYLNLDKNGSLLVTTIKKTKQGLEVEESFEFFFKPCYQIEEKKVRMFLNNPRSLQAEMKIYDSNGILVGESNSKEQLIKKVFDFSKVPKGYYRVEVEINNQKFNKEIEVS